MKPENQLILVETINSLSQNIEKLQNNAISSDQFSNLVYETAANAVTKTIEHLFHRHNLTLPPRWTHEQILQDILGDDLTLTNVTSVLKNITQLGLASDEFHQVLNVLHLTGGGGGFN
uniref:Uncharacterized protein n=1 Tax=Arabidopsis thaliana TaxID=3702 RepID=M1X5D4_ARATH|nr:hypothetical protein [Arabidopsis thaliana]